MRTTADKLARLNETKALLKTRLTEKGLDVASEDNFYNLANKVGEIQSGSIEVLTWDISPQDYIDTSTWYDEDQMNEFNEGKWAIKGPYVFKNNTYNNLTELLEVVPSSAIYFFIKTSGGPEMYFKRPTTLVEGAKFVFISKNYPLIDTTFYMFVDFGQKII